MISCDREKFLAEKPSSSIMLPQSPEDYQAILDYYYLNYTGALSEVSSDNFYLDLSSWDLLNVIDKNAYIWASDIYEGSTAEIVDWDALYTEVYTANVVLDGIKKLDKAHTGNSYEFVKGHALFLRGYALFNLAQHFCLAYDEKSFETDMGLPIPLTANINKLEKRSTLRETYDQIEKDLIESLRYIHVLQPNHNINRPSKASVYAMLSRLYLSMRKYDKAGAYADSCLRTYDKLTDFNQLNISTRIPFDRNPSEVLYQSYVPSFATSLLSASNSISFIDSLLFSMYEDDDLRKIIYFRESGGRSLIKGGFNGTLTPFTGLAVDEIYLNKAESFARSGRIDDAMKDLNTLLEKRYKTGEFVPRVAENQLSALNEILNERRKELIWRGLRWVDIRRLNKEGANIHLQRKLGSQTFSLEPNSPRYALPIPLQEIQLSGIDQNPR